MPEPPPLQLHPVLGAVVLNDKAEYATLSRTEVLAINEALTSLEEELTAEKASNHSRWLRVGTEMEKNDLLRSKVAQLEVAYTEAWHLLKIVEICSQQFVGQRFCHSTNAGKFCERCIACQMHQLRRGIAHRTERKFDEASGEISSQETGP